MRSWTKIIKDHHSWAHPNDGYKLVLRNGASEAELNDLAQAIGFQFPSEFRELYRCHNGVGVSHTHDPDKIYWSFVPLSEIPELISNARDWFQKTHPDLAARFFPFIDWSSGDYTGYLLAPDRSLLAGLYDFEHEEYQFDESQQSDEFMMMFYSSIAESLTLR